MGMTPRTKLPAVVREEQKKQRIEAAALAAYQMEQGTYHYPAGTHRGHIKPDGSREWNKMELLRVFGHKHDGHADILFDDPHFMRMVEYHRWRGSDPMFRKKIKNQIWAEVADELSLQIYEQVKFHPDALTYEQKLKTMKLIIDAGVKFASKQSKNRQQELLAGMDEKDRAKLIEEQIREAERKADNLRATKAALEGADYVEGEAEEDD